MARHEYHVASTTIMYNIQPQYLYICEKYFSTKIFHAFKHSKEVLLWLKNYPKKIPHIINGLFCLTQLLQY